MKKIFTLILALVGLTNVVNAASTIDDVTVCKHSYVFVADDYTNNGATARVKGSLFGDNHFLDVTGGSIDASKKGDVDLSKKDSAGNYVYLDGKYAEYGKHHNSLRLKKSQDVIAMKVTAKSKLIFFVSGNNSTGKSARIPCIASDAALKTTLNAAPTDDNGTVGNDYMYEWTAPDDATIYIGSYNGDMYLSYIIVEANETPGTPTVKVSKQAYADGLWYREVTCTANEVVEEGSDVKSATIVTYTTDGTAPTATSSVYKEPIKCYSNQTVKFQAYLDFGDGTISDDASFGQRIDGADNEGVVSFSFDAPTMTVDGAKVTVKSAYEGAENYFCNGDTVKMTSESITLSESATVSAYSVIKNGSYATFTTKSVSSDVLVLDPIKEEKTIAVTAGSAVVDEVATAAATDGSTVYVIKDGAISADKKDFFVKNLTFAALANADAAKAKYQVPAGQEAYIQMSNTNIIFKVAEGDSVDVKVITSLNSCKNVADTTANNRLVYVQVSGKTYGGADMADETLATRNVIEFGLKGAAGGSTFTFEKYSGTGNILISSINIKPVAADAGVHEITAATAAKTVKCVENGQLVIKSAKGTFTAAGARLK